MIYEILYVSKIFVCPWPTWGPGPGYSEALHAVFRPLADLWAQSSQGEQFTRLGRVTKEKESSDFE